MDDIISNPVKAGSIEFPGVETNDPDFYQFMNADNIFRKNIRDETKYFQQIRKPVQGDYKPYEVILPDKFQVPQVKYVDTRKIYGIGKIEDEFKAIDYKIDARQVTMRDPNNDCQGEWSQWNEDNCYNPNKRCSLKYRRYNITKEKREQGLSCEYNGRKVDDGDLDYDYCYGGNNEERCNYQGNLCECNLDDMDDPDSHCDVELNNMCVCPDDLENDANGRCPQPPPEPEETDTEGTEGTEIYYGKVVYESEAPTQSEFIDLLVGYLQGINDDINRDSISNVNVRIISGTTTFTFTVTCVNCSGIETNIRDFERDQNGSDPPDQSSSSNCVGSWSICDTSCNKTYTITSEAEGTGNQCPETSGATEICSPSEGNCPGPPPSTPPSPPPSTPPPPPYVPPTQEESRHDETLKETIRRNYIILFIALMFITIIILSMFVY
jgi:hypothetical protein